MSAASTDDGFHGWNSNDLNPLLDWMNLSTFVFTSDLKPLSGASRVTSSPKGVFQWRRIMCESSRYRAFSLWISPHDYSTNTC